MTQESILSDDLDLYKTIPQKKAIFEGVLDFNLQPQPLARTQGSDAME